VERQRRATMPVPALRLFAAIAAPLPSEFRQGNLAPPAHDPKSGTRFSEKIMRQR
jgi:hypothetical protein